MTTAEMLLYLYAESPVHAGAGEGDGVVDLPIQRESTTQEPVIWGQSLKGALRHAAVAAQWARDLVTQVFGAEVTSGSGTDAGRLAVGDAQLVALPVPTLHRTYAWVTTSRALSRLARKYHRLGGADHAIPACRVDAAAAIGQPWANPKQPRQVLGPCVVPVDTADGLDLWAERIATHALPSRKPFEPFRAKFGTDLLLVGGDAAGWIFSAARELLPRVALSDSKEVENLFYAEYLPTETILASSLTLFPSSGKAGAEPGTLEKSLSELLDGEIVQIGGHETIGKGLMWARLHNPKTIVEVDA